MNSVIIMSPPISYIINPYIILCKHVAQYSKPVNHGNEYPLNKPHPGIASRSPKQRKCKEQRGIRL